MIKWEKLEEPFRVEIPAYTDMWMRGARFGEAIARLPGGIGDSGSLLRVVLDATGKMRACIEADCKRL